MLEFRALLCYDVLPFKEFLGEVLFLIIQILKWGWKLSEKLLLRKTFFKEGVPLAGGFHVIPKYRYRIPRF